MLAPKIKALLSLTRQTHADLSRHMNISAQALSGKLARDSFTPDELLTIAEFCGCQLCFIFPNGDRISLDK